jgi:hypothetical protein
VGERRLRSFAEEAGFSRVDLLASPQSPFNLIIERKE